MNEIAYMRDTADDDLLERRFRKLGSSCCIAKEIGGLVGHGGERYT